MMGMPEDPFWKVWDLWKLLRCEGIRSGLGFALSLASRFAAVAHRGIAEGVTRQERETSIVARHVDSSEQMPVGATEQRGELTKLLNQLQRL